jgi:hypothetical protein
MPGSVGVTPAVLAGAGAVSDQQSPAQLSPDPPEGNGEHKGGKGTLWRRRCLHGMVMLVEREGAHGGGARLRVYVLIWLMLL